jgi:hypothetical protein
MHSNANGFFAYLCSHYGISTGRAILEFSIGFEVGVGIIFVAGRKRPASSRGLEHMFLSNYQSKKTNIETQICLLEREKRGH